MSEFTSKIRTIEWIDTYSRMVDQTKFPEKFEYINITTGQDMFDAIKTMIVSWSSCYRNCRCSRCCTFCTGTRKRKSFS